MSKIEEARDILDEVLQHCLKVKNKSLKGGNTLTVTQWRNRRKSSAFAIVGLMEHQIATEAFDKAAVRHAVGSYRRNSQGADYSDCFGATRGWPDGRTDEGNVEKPRPDESFFV